MSDADGRFTVTAVASGQVSLRLNPEQAGQRHPEWSPAYVSVEVHSGALADVGTIELLARELDDGDERGDLGYAVERWDRDGEDLEEPITVRRVDAGGAAAEAGLAVGDQITEVGAHDVRGNGKYLYATAVAVAPGALVVLGLADGRTLELYAR